MRGGKRGEIKNYMFLSLFLSGLVVFTFLSAYLVLADSDSTTFSWVIPENINHALSYGGSCSSTSVFFNENCALDYNDTVNGTANRTIPYHLSSGCDSAPSTTWCQNDTVPLITITNNGNVLLYINASFSAITSGVYVKSWLYNVTSGGCSIKGGNGFYGWQATCTTPRTDPLRNDTCKMWQGSAMNGTGNNSFLVTVAVSGTNGTCWTSDFIGLSQGTTTGNLITNSSSTA